MNERVSVITWQENESAHTCGWRSASNSPAPRQVVVVDDSISADTAFRLASEGTALLWMGDFQNARQLLQAVSRRIDHSLDKRSRRAGGMATASMKDRFNVYRQMQSQRIRTLGMLLVPMTADYKIPLRRAPDVSQACLEAYGPVDARSDQSGNIDSALSLRELQGVISAHEWRKKGIEIHALGARIHPHYGVFAPVRNEYIDLIATLPLPNSETAIDIGTGTGVIAAVLAHRGVAHVTATDIDWRAVACAQQNVQRLQFERQVTVEQTDLFPKQKAGLIICNPPWLPARPASLLDHAVYDPGSQMLRGFLNGLSAHLVPGGEGWLVLSDLAEHLQLRSREALLAMFDEANLKILAKHDTQPNHARVSDTSDFLHHARAAEITSVWRLAPG